MLQSGGPSDDPRTNRLKRLGGVAMQVTKYSDHRPHPNSSGGGIIMLLLIAFIWLLVETWPWWLLVPPVVILLVLAFKPSLRRKVATAFKCEGVEPDIASFRKRVMWTLFVIGAISTLVCALGTGLNNAEWWLIPLFLIAPMLRLCSLSIDRGRWHRLKRALCENLAELLFITGTVLAFYSVALWWFQTLPLDEMTIGKLKELDRKLQEIHEFFERHKPGFVTFLVFLGTVILLRLAAGSWPKLKSTTSIISTLLVKGVKWTERASCVVAVAASLTFLGSKVDGLGARVSIALRDAAKDYSQFQSAVRKRVDQSLRQKLLTRALAEKPLVLRSEMAHAAEFQKERRQFEAARSIAKASLDIEPAAVENFPLSLEISSQAGITVWGAAADNLSPSWTPRALREAVEESDALPAPNAILESSKQDEKADEMARDALNELSPADKLFDKTFLTVLKVHYPVVGEFLDAVSSSVSDTLFDSARDSIVQKIIQRRFTRRDSVKTALADEIDAEVRTVHLNWSRFDGNWNRTTHAEIERYRAAIAVAQRDLEKMAVEKQAQRFQAVLRSIWQKSELVDKAGRAIGSDVLPRRAAALRRYAKSIEALGQRWPPVKEANTNQRSHLHQIYSRFVTEFSEQTSKPIPSENSAGANSLLAIIFSTDASSSPDSSSGNDMEGNRSRAFLLGSWGSPLEGAAALESYCDEQLEQVVANSAGSTGSDVLRTVLGSRYQFYYDDWQKREKVRKLQAEVRRQQIAEEERAAERMREELRRAEEMRRAYEHPVEVPY